jgi:hypothetical protein
MICECVSTGSFAKAFAVSKALHEKISGGRILVMVEKILRYISVLVVKASQGLQKLCVTPVDALNVIVAATVFPAPPPVTLYLAMGRCGQACLAQGIRERAKTKADVPGTGQIGTAFDKPV